MADFTIKKLTEVNDSAAQFGVGESQEARFANDDLETQDTGFSHHKVKPGKRQAFGHRHEDAEEVYVVISVSGRMRLDDEIVEVSELHAIRVSPEVTRAFEADDEGLELLAFGPRRKGDGEIIQDFWTD